MTITNAISEPTRYDEAGNESADGLLIFYEDWKELKQRAEQAEQRAREARDDANWAERELLEVMRIAMPDPKEDDIIRMMKLHGIRLMLEPEESHERYMKLVDKHMEPKAALDAEGKAT